MSYYNQKLIFLTFLNLFIAQGCLNLFAQTQSNSPLTLFSPAALLIQHEYVRSELALSNEQTQGLDRVCDQLNPLLFAMRDVPANTSAPKALSMAQQINEAVKSLDPILNLSQQQRLEQLCLQYTGTKALLDTDIQSKLNFTKSQIESIQKLHQQSLTQQKNVQQKSKGQNNNEARKEIEKIYRREVNQIMQVMSNEQRQRWLVMLGEAFDFSRLQPPLLFRVPELENVTAWINTKPLSMQDLRGRVVIVHFWTFGCGNCIQNYPVYREWARQYDPKEVFILGIHTPEANYEKDVKTVQKKMKQDGLSFTVAIDNDKTNWDAWSNRMWPSVYLVDKRGNVRYWWYGELRWQGATGDKWMTERIEELKAEKGFN